MTLPGVTGEKTVADGKVVLTNNDLPTTATTGKGSAQEDGKLPTQGTTDIEIPAKLVASATPTFTVGKQDPKTGTVEVTVGGGVSDGAKVTLPGVTAPKVVQNGKVVLTNDDLPVTEDKTGKGIAQEDGKLPTASASDITIPKKLVSTATPTFTVGKQDPTTGSVEVTVGGGVSDGAKVILPGVTAPKVVQNGKVVLTNDDLPVTEDKTGKGIAQEDGKLPTASASDITIPKKLVSTATPTGDDHQGLITPSADTNRRPDNATPAEVPATQPAEQPSQTVEVPAQLPNEVSETDSSVSQPQAVLPNTGTQEDRATGAFGVLSLLGAFGLLFAKKKKDDEEEA